jgi:non-canonical (house-cleaning) NTP pyrophosphatase
MIIAIGSRAESKVGAVGRAFSKYIDVWTQKGLLGDGISYLLLPKDLRDGAVDKVSGVSHTPLSLKETIQGAKNRAKFTYNYFAQSPSKAHEVKGSGGHPQPNYAIGVEGGLEKIDGEYYMTGAAVIYDGKEFYTGVCPAVVIPEAVTNEILKGKECGNIGDHFGVATLKGRGGIAGQLTQGRILREDFEEIAVTLALSKIVSSEVY